MVLGNGSIYHSPPSQSLCLVEGESNIRRPMACSSDNFDQLYLLLFHVSYQNLH